MRRVHEALEPPLDVEALRSLIPELDLARNLEQSPYHHLDTLDHVLEVIRGVERELDEKRVGAEVFPENLRGLRLAALLHDIAKPITRGEIGGKVLFVAHDTLGAGLIRRICGRLGTSARDTDIAVTLTELHLKIGFMESTRTDYPPARLVRAAGPFGEELAVLSWADRLAAQGPSLTGEHIGRHHRLCAEFLYAYRENVPYPSPNYEWLAEELDLSAGADVGYAASRLRLLRARELANEEAIRYVDHVLHNGGK